MTESSILSYVTDVLQHIERGDTSTCLNILWEGTRTKETDLLELTLKNVVQRQLLMESELIRARTALSKQSPSSTPSPSPVITTPAGPDRLLHHAAVNAAASSNTMAVVSAPSAIPSYHASSAHIQPNSPAPLPSVTPMIIKDNAPDPSATAIPISNAHTGSGSSNISSHSTLLGGPVMHPFPGFSFPATPDELPVCNDCLTQCTQVAIAVTSGDFGQRVNCPHASGPMLALKTAVNTMADQIYAFAEEAGHVAREVGREGKLDVQAHTDGLQGTWLNFMSDLNKMASNHAVQVRDIAEVCTAVAHGDLSKKVGVDVKGETLVLKNTINTMVDQLNSFASEVTRVAHQVGTEGKLGVQAEVEGIGGTWKLLTDNVNTMAANLTGQVRDIANVSKAVAKGDLSRKVKVPVKGEMLDLKNTINTMVDNLQTFATEVTRVSLEVGTEGKLGGQAVVKDVGGTWKDLTDNVNLMASNLTAQVRDIATVCKAVAQGDLSRKVTVPVQGEILELKDTINTMVGLSHAC